MLPFELTKDTPYLALSGELWSVFYEYFNRNWSCYKGFLLYLFQATRTHYQVTYLQGCMRASRVCTQAAVWCRPPHRGLPAPRPPVSCARRWPHPPSCTSRNSCRECSSNSSSSSRRRVWVRGCVPSRLMAQSTQAWWAILASASHTKRRHPRPHRLLMAKVIPSPLTCTRTVMEPVPSHSCPRIALVSMATAQGCPHMGTAQGCPLIMAKSALVCRPMLTVLQACTPTSGRACTQWTPASHTLRACTRAVGCPWAWVHVWAYPAGCSHSTRICSRAACLPACCTHSFQWEYRWSTAWSGPAVHALPPTSLHSRRPDPPRVRRPRELPVIPAPSLARLTMQAPWCPSIPVGCLLAWPHDQPWEAPWCWHSQLWWLTIPTSSITYST